MTDNTVHYASRCLIDIMRQHGIKNAVACPGSRNTPLLIALSRCKDIHTTMIVDERVAGFVALGMAAQSSKPIALVCTSGTAMLNFAPAVAEAYYRKLPIIVITADRPTAWIDQDDSQTIRQFKALDNFVKQSYDIPSFDNDEFRWYANRIFNDAIIESGFSPKGPVHINIQIGEPIGATEMIDQTAERCIKTVIPRDYLPVTEVRKLGLQLASPRKVMIIAGFSEPNAKVNKALNRLSQLSNIVVFTESIANLHGNNFISEIDSVLSYLDKQKRESMAPDVVITIGGALISRFVKEYIRKQNNIEHWIIGKNHTTIDCFRQLQLRIEISPDIFLPQLASAMQPHRSHSEYRQQWLEARNKSRVFLQNYVANVPWCDLKAFATFMPMIPRNVNLQLSNGTPIRYAQLFGYFNFHRCDCNRGVSGIDGSTSTAIGASLLSKDRLTILISGDMSAQYDVGALMTGLLTPRFKMIVMCNGGGGIFHFIKSTHSLDIVEDCFDAPCHFPAERLAQSAGMEYFAVRSECELIDVWPSFISETKRPAMLAIYTDGELSGQALREFFSHKHSQK